MYYSRKELGRIVKLLSAAHMWIFVTRDLQEIARAVNVRVSKLKGWMSRKDWDDALAFWDKTRDTIDPELRIGGHGDLKIAYKVWHDLCARGKLIPGAAPSECSDELKYKSDRDWNE